MASCWWYAEPPAELRRDVPQDALDGVGVVVDAELVRNGEQDRVGRGDGRVRRQLPDENLGLGGVGAAEDRSRVLVDVADLVVLLLAPAEVGAVAVVDDGEDAAAHRDSRLARVTGLSPGLAVRIDLPALLHVERFAGLVEHEGRAHEVHA
jgi:hypothetical protein